MPKADVFAEIGVGVGNTGIFGMYKYRKSRAEINRIRRELRAKDDGLVAWNWERITPEMAHNRAARMYNHYYDTYPKDENDPQNWRNDPTYNLSCSRGKRP